MTRRAVGERQSAPLLTARLSSPRNKVVACEVVGEVDLSTAPLLRTRLQQATADGPKHLVVDMASVTFICAVGLGVLLEARAKQNDGFELVLVGNTRPVVRVLEGCGLGPEFRRYPDLDSAVAACVDGRGLRTR